MNQGVALDFVQTHSLVSALRLELERMILGGDIKVGERLNETVLAAHFKTSRGPLREALQALGEQGLVSFTRNRGASIRRVSPAEAFDLYSVRAALEDEVGRRLAGRLSDAQNASLWSLLKEMDRHIKNRSVSEYYHVNLRFHARLVSYAGNVRLEQVYRQVIKELHLFRLNGLSHGAALEMSNTEHREIMEALQAGSATKASKAMRGHVEAALQRVQALAQPAVPDG